jgi:hypothetical protein
MPGASRFNVSFAASELYLLTLSSVLVRSAAWPLSAAAACSTCASEFVVRGSGHGDGAPRVQTDLHHAVRRKTMHGAVLFFSSFLNHDDDTSLFPFPSCICFPVLCMETSLATPAGIMFSGVHARVFLSSEV